MIYFFVQFELNVWTRWVPQLRETATSLGLETVTYETVPMTDHYRPFWNQSNLLALDDFASKIKGDQATEVEDLLKTVDKEFAQGVSLDAEWFCYVCRKPL